MKIYNSSSLTVMFVAILTFIPSLQAENIAFFYALENDLQTFTSETKVQPTTISVEGRKLYLFKIGGNQIIAVKMGSGPVQTSISSQLLLSKYKCDIAFSLGPVGTLDDKIEIGSWLLISESVAYQKGSWQAMGFALSPEAHLQSSDKGFKRVQEVLPELWGKAKTVVAASGEAFIASDSYRDQLRDQSKAQVVDMNFFGLMSVCEANGVPLVSWRIVSDKADDRASEDFRKFLDGYQGEGGRLLAQILLKIPPNPESPQTYPAIREALEKP